MLLPNSPGLWYNVSMKQCDCEPGFLQAYRLFVVTRIVFWVVIGPILVVMQMAQVAGAPLIDISGMNLVERLTLPNVAPVIVIELLLLVLLLLPQVPRRLGKWFVPLTLLIGLVPLLIGNYWWPSENPLQTPFAIFFFVMLVLIGWQYPFRYVIVYVLGLTLYQVWLMLPMVDGLLSFDVGWLVLQGAMMLIVGYVIVQLVSIQREQRAALAEAYEQQAAATARLQRYAAALEELTISRERNRMARELHDTLAHSLSALAVQLEAVRSLWSVDPGAAQDMLERADETARRGLKEARRALQDLRASPLHERGLPLALRDLAEMAAERTGAALELHIPERWGENVPPAVEQGVYRIAQEALENVVRHAGARTLVVRLEQNEARLALTVEDDGQGIDLEDVQPGTGDTRSRLGLRGMRERAGLIGGQIEIVGQAEQGTRIELTVPL
jgi:signal transduction histidine kinase